MSTYDLNQILLAPFHSFFTRLKTKKPQKNEKVELTSIHTPKSQPNEKKKCHTFFHPRFGAMVLPNKSSSPELPKNRVSKLSSGPRMRGGR